MADAQLTRFESMTNVELRAELKRRGCPTSGNKKDLLAKLRASLEKEYEQNLPQHSVGYPQNETPVTYTNLQVKKFFLKKNEKQKFSLGYCSVSICINRTKYLSSDFYSSTITDTTTTS
jgi:hypothetical protein